MKAVLYEKPYKNPVQQIAYDGFAAIGERKVTGRVTVPHEQLEALFAMTPYYWKTPRAATDYRPCCAVPAGNRYLVPVPCI